MPQTFIGGIGRTIIKAHSPLLTDMLNVIHWHKASGPITVADCQAVTNQVHSWLTASYLDIVSEHVTFDFIHSRSMETGVAPYYTLPEIVSGGVAGECLPYHVSLFSVFHGDVTSRRARGGFHSFPTKEADNDATGVPDPTYVVAVQACMEQLLASFVSGDYTLAVASFTHQTWVPVANITTNAKWGSVNSRKVGHGR